MTKTLLSMIAALALTGPVAAQGVFVSPATSSAVSTAPLTGIRASVARQLPKFGYRNVDVRRLSTSQVAMIHHLLHSDRTSGDIRLLIRGTLNRGPLQRGLDRVTR